MAVAGGSKIVKPGGEKLDKLEELVSHALVELESNVEIRHVLREVFFLGAKEVDAAGKKAICVYVPVPQQKQFQKMQEEGRFVETDRAVLVTKMVAVAGSRQPRTKNLCPWRRRKSLQLATLLTRTFVDGCL